MTLVLPCCIECQCHFATAKNEVMVLEIFPDGRPYQITAADLLQCPECGKLIVSGFGRDPVSMHHHDDFADYLDRVDFTITSNPQRVEQWHRPKKETDTKSPFAIAFAAVRVNVVVDGMSLIDAKTFIEQHFGELKWPVASRGSTRVELSEGISIEIKVENSDDGE